ncbi:MAG: hypothetical protein ABR980_08145 [Ignavibacteriaceae bacterium]
MKKFIFYTITLLSFFMLSACRMHDRDNFDNIDNTPPAPPTGIVILNGDNRVDISWNLSPEHDVEGYNVYSSFNYYGKYTLIGSTKNNYFTDYSVKNAITYFYAVTAYDYNGNESELSKQDISATPRPEGFNETIFNYRSYPGTSGFSFNSFSVVQYNDKTADFFYDNNNGTPFIGIWSDTYIQDMGPTTDIYDIPYAPTTGWTSATDAVAIAGHTYAIWTWDNYYAKIRVSSITTDRMIFDWAFQTVLGNPELKIGRSNAVRGTLQRKSLNRN